MNNNIPNIPLTGHLLSQTMDGYITGAKYIDGTYIVVKTLAERDDLANVSVYAEKVLAVGTPVYVSDDKKLYRWNGSTWDEEKIDFSEIESQIATLDGKITATDANVLSNTQAIANIDSDVSDIKESITTIQTDITDINSDIVGINNTIDSINSSLTEKATIEYVDEAKQNLTDSVSALQESVSNINTEVSNLQTDKLDESTYTQDKETFATKSQVATDINRLKQELDNGYATDAELTALSTAIEQQLANKASNDDLSNLSTTLADLTRTVSANKTAAETAHQQLQDDITANQDAIQRNLNQIESTLENIGTIQTVLEQHRDEYEGKVSKNITDIETLTSAVNDLETNAATKTELQNGLAGKLDISTYNTDKENFATKTELNNKATKATTLAGYGITDAYTKTQVNTELDKKATNDSLNTLQNTVNNKANSSTVDTLSGKVTNLEKNKLDKVLYQNPTLVGTALGGIQAGTNLQGMTIQEILTKVFEVALVNITLDPNNPTTITIGKQAIFKVIANPEGFDLRSIAWQANPATYLQFVSNNDDGVNDDGVDCEIEVLDTAPDGHKFTLTATYGQFTITTPEITCIAPVILTPAETIIQDRLAIQIGTSSNETAAEFNILNAEAMQTPSNQGFFNTNSAMGYQVITPTTGKSNLVISIPSITRLSDLTFYDTNQSKWVAYIPDAEPRWSQVGTKLINGVKYTNYTVNVKSAGETVRFIIENN